MEAILNELNLNEENICSVNPHLNILYRKKLTKHVKEEAVKLRTYALFKSNFQKEVYLETVKNVQKRKRLKTQFRVSAHSLEVESGSYEKKTVSERICKFCNLNTVEDEVHFYVIVLLTKMKGNSFLNILLTVLLLLEH